MTASFSPLMNSTYNFNLYIKSKCSERTHFQVPLGVLYIQIYLYLHREKWSLFICLFVCLMVFNATFKIFQLYRGGQFLSWGRKPVKTTDLPQVTDKRYPVMFCTSTWSRFKLFSGDRHLLNRYHDHGHDGCLF